MPYPELDPRALDREELALWAERDKRLLMRNQLQQRRRYEESLIEFMIAAWPHMGEAGECVINWHHEEIADALEALVEPHYDEDDNLILGGNLVINQPPRPVDEHAIVLTARGPALLRDVIVGDEVLTHRGRYRPVLEVHKQGQLPVLKITTEAGRAVRAAADHPFLTTEGWINAGALRAGHILAATSAYLDEDRGAETMTPEAARFLAYLIGDGSVGGGAVAFWNADEDVLADFERCAQSLGFQTKLKLFNGCRCPAVTVNSNRDGSLQRFLAKHKVKGRTSYTEQVPLDVLRGTREIVANFVGAFATCDGHFKIRSHRDGRLGHQVKLTTVSYKLAIGLQHLCLRIGIPMRVRTRRTKMETKRQPGGIYVSYDVQTTDQHTVAKFKALPGLCERKRAAIAAAMPLTFDTHLFPDEVVSVEADGEAECRCLLVDEDHSFTANDLAVHNTTKSTLLLCFNAWVWAQPSDRWNRLRGPHVKFLTVSYSSRLAEKFGTQFRRLILSEWYQTLWGHQVIIRADQGSRSDFANTAGGSRFSGSIIGGVLGSGGDIQLIDDPQNYDQAESEVKRENTTEAMRMLVNRVTDPRHTARILVMQRLNQNDATQYAIDNWSRKTQFICFPMRYDITRPDPRDHRENDGELLWPEIWTEALVKEQENELLEYGTAGQLQQRPIPRGGGIIKHDWWKVWPDDAEAQGLADLRIAYHCPMCKWADYVEGNWAIVPCPQCGSDAARFTPFPLFSYRLISVDTNYGQGEQNSYSAATAWAIWHDKHGAPRLMLTDAWRGRPRLRGDPNARDPLLKLGLVEIVYGMAKRRQTDLILIERKTRGTDLYNELERITREWPFQLMYTDPTHKGSKTLRLESCVNMFVNGLVWAPNLDYATMVIEEVCGAPYMPFDDLMDTCLVAGTKIATKRGQVAIEEVRAGDEVFTPIGFRRVTWAGLTGVKPVITRGELSGTANHPTFLIDRGWSRLDTATDALSFSRLTLCDLIRLALPRQWNLWASGITAWAGSGNITSRSADRRESRRDFMSRFGSMLTAGKCRPTMKSTTSTTTRLIAILGIWSAYRLRCIAASPSSVITNRWSSILSVFGRWRTNGTSPRWDERGTEATLQRLCQSLMLLNGSGWPRRRPARQSASGAERNSFARPPSGNIAAALAPARLASTELVAKPFDLAAVNAALGVGRNLPSSHRCEPPASTAPTNASVSATIMWRTPIQPSSIPVPIFNLSVEEAECFYANGVLVHNCTAALRHVRDHGLLLTGTEHRIEEVARTAFRGRQFDANEVFGLV